jgi:hypothetical protein
MPTGCFLGLYVCLELGELRRKKRRERCPAAV